MDNKRMRQVTLMFSSITGTSLEEARRLILSTDTGKAIEKNNAVVLYEQHTENLNEIAFELREKGIQKEIEDAMSPQAIYKAMIELPKLEENIKIKTVEKIVIEKNPMLKAQIKECNKKREEKAIRVRKQNQMNKWRAENADKFKR